MPTIGLVANVYNEANALPGWIEAHISFFDDVRVMHAGPGGEYSKDGTLEILNKWRIPVEFCSIDLGFGVVRTNAVRMSPCDYVMILDADERFYPVHRRMICTGESTPRSEVDSILQTYDFSDVRTVLPNWENVGRLGANLRVDIGESYNQGERLREILEVYHPDAICSIRRHWHNFNFRRPTQNWHTDPDWQMRIVRNHPSIGFDPGTKMHERLGGANNVFQADMERGPFFDHFHFSFKRMEVEQRAHDVAIYNAIHEGRPAPKRDEYYINMWAGEEKEQLFGGVKKDSKGPGSQMQCPWCASFKLVTDRVSWYCESCGKGDPRLANRKESER